MRNGGVGMPSFSKKLNEVQISQVAEFVSESTRSSTMGGSVAAGFKPDDTKIEDCQTTDFHCYEQAFANISYKDSPKTALDLFDKDIKTPGPIERDCHRIAHAIGAGALSHFHGNVGQAFVAGRPSCTSGYYHGILERAFLGVDQSKLGSSARKFCASPEVRKSEFIAYQCVHGLGHGLMIYTGYDMPLSLHTCDKLASGWDATGCTGGVFMENYQSSYGIVSRWLKAKDLIYPCNSVAEKYKFYCYDLVTARILPKVNYNWKKAAAWCRKSEKNWVKVCFQSMGRDASGFTRLDPPAIIKICGNAKDMAGRVHLRGREGHGLYGRERAPCEGVVQHSAGIHARLLLARDRRDPRVVQPRDREAQGELRRGDGDQAALSQRLLRRRRGYLARSLSLQNAGMSRPVLAALMFVLLTAGCGGKGHENSSGSTSSLPGAKVFDSAGCGGCHTLSAAKSKGTVGPNLDQLRPDPQTVARQVKTAASGMPSFSKKLNEVQISQVAEFVSESTRSSTMGGSVAAGFKPDDTKLSDCKPTDFHCYEQAFANISYNDGPRTALDEFDQDIKTPGPIERDCHRIAHAIGAGALSHFHGNIGQAFVAGRPSCTSGYYHGILERAFLGVPQGQLGAKARAFCSEPGGSQVRVHRLPVRPRARTRADDLYRVRPARLAAHVRQAPTGRPAQLHGRRLHGELPVLVRRRLALAEGRRT